MDGQWWPNVWLVDIMSLPTTGEEGIITNDMYCILFHFLNFSYVASFSQQDCRILSPYYYWHMRNIGFVLCFWRPSVSYSATHSPWHMPIPDWIGLFRPVSQDSWTQIQTGASEIFQSISTYKTGTNENKYSSNTCKGWQQLVCSTPKNNTAAITN